MQLTRWCDWESSLRKLLSDVELGVRITVDNPAEESPCNDVHGFTDLTIIAEDDNVPISTQNSIGSSRTNDHDTRLLGTAEQSTANMTPDSDSECRVLSEDAAVSECDAVSEVSSCFQDSPRKPPADLLPLLHALQAALHKHQLTESQSKNSLQTDLQAVEREKAQLQDRFNQTEADLQVNTFYLLKKITFAIYL